MPKEYTAPAPFTNAQMPDIPLTPVQSNQVAAIGYDPLTKTLAVTFTRGPGTIYHYPEVEPKTHAEFMSAESIGKYFGAHIKPLPFKKYPAPAKTEPATTQD